MRLRGPHGGVGDVLQVILRWHLQSGYGHSESTNPQHIEQNVDIFDFEFTDPELARFMAIDRNRPSFRLPCWFFGPITRMAPVSRDLG